MNNKHIVWIMPRYHTNLVGLFSILQNAGYWISCLVMYKGNAENYDCVEPIQIPIQKYGEFINRIRNVHSDSVLSSKYRIPDIIWLFQYLRNHKPQYVVLREFSTFYSIIAFIMCSLTRLSTPVLYTQHPNSIEKGDFIELIKRYIIKLIYRGRWFTTADDLTVKSVDKRGSTHLVPFMVNPDVRALQRDYSSDICRIMIVAKYEIRKKIPETIKACHILIQEGYRINLTVVGQAYLPRHDVHKHNLEVLIDELDMGNCVTLVDNLDYCDVKDMYLCHDLYVLASDKEPASVSQVEAMAAGLGAIVSRSCGTAYYVHHMQTGYLCESNVESIALAIKWCISEGGVERLGRASLDRLTTDFNESIILDRFYRCIK